MDENLGLTRIVLITDTPQSTRTFSPFDRDIDQPSSDYIEEWKNAIIDNGFDLIHYCSPQDFARNIHLHIDDHICPYWFGKNSRNRHGFIPAICESHGIRYMGGDAYTKIICNDKALSKLLCRKLGLNIAESVICSDITDFELFDNLNFPCVIKPIYEGTSLGISHSNLVQDSAEAKVVVNQLLNEFDQPIMVEEFIVGKEVSICLLGQSKEIKLWAAAERYIIEDEKFFYSHLYTFEEKRDSKFNLGLRSVRDEISPNVLHSCKELFKSLGKVEYMRIDGKLNNGEFTVIELSPDTHLGKDSEFCGTIISNQEIDFKPLVKLMVTNSVESYQNQNPST